MAEPQESIAEVLVVVERDGVHRFEVREVLQEGDAYFVLFARLDGTQVRVTIDGAKLKKTVNGQVPANLIYNGGALETPQQDL